MARHSHAKRYIIVTLGLLVLVGILAGLKIAEISTVMAAGKKMQKAGPPPETVNAAAAEEQTWEDTLDSVGSVTAARGGTISNESAGIVTQIHFESGAAVRAGDVLVELDDHVERWQLAAAVAKKRLAEINLGKSRALVASNAIPKIQLDNDEAEAAGTSADVKALGAQVERKVLRAPFAGKVGIRLVNIGQFLPAGTPVTVLESTEATAVDFSLPQQDLPLVKVGMPVKMMLGARDVDASASAQGEGTIVAIDPALDATTRNIKVRASTPSNDDRFRPGMFVNVSVVLPQKQAVVAIPATAVVHASFGDSVFVVESDVAREQFVRLGRMRGDFVAVADGIKAGQEVVTGGAFKLRNGARVAVQNDVQLRPELSPHPVNR